MNFVSNLLIKLGAAGLVVMTAIISWQVFGRFVLNSSPSWSDQAALILMVWYVFFAAAAGVHEGFHIRIALLETMLPEAWGRALRRLIHVLVALGGIVLLIYGLELTWLVRMHLVPSLGISRGLAYLPIPFCGLLIAVFAMRHFFAEGKSPVTGGGSAPDNSASGGE
jgi:TRAP-type C4-dicarboxylate transport system permease small subunit